MATITNIAEYKADVTRQIFELEELRLTIESDLRCGIIDSVGAVRKEEMINSKILKAKKSALAKIHIRKDGTLKEITYLENQNIWRTFVKDKKAIYGKDEATIIDKLFDYYGLSLGSTIFKDVFEAALKEKSETENVKEATIEHLESEYKRFFVSYSNSFPKKDIRYISATDLKAYTQKLTNDTHPTLAAFKAYKGILNLIFGYAFQNGMIGFNPVVCIKNSAYNKSMSATKRRPEEKIFSQEEIEMIKAEVNKRINSGSWEKKYNGYFINGYAILFSIETGVRVAELCSLKWSDIKDNYIWIHSQQLQTKNGWEYCPYTKNERLLPPDERLGREFPLTKNLKAILYDLKGKQSALGINSEYIFCHEDGEWIKTKAYQTCLRRLIRHVLGNDTITNNHAFRMSLNSNVFIPKGLPVTERARLLGHSVETNLKRYSFAGKGNIDDICSLLDA